MYKIEIQGGNQLNGTIDISGAKNATLPLMTASILTDQPIILNRVPNLRDVSSLCALLNSLGVATEYNSTDKTMHLNAKEINSYIAPYELVSKMRASILVLGPLLARYGEAKVSLPGGCAIGTRPVDLHIEALKQLGAEIDLVDGYIHAKAPNGLKGANIHFQKTSVGATENILMAATIAKGITVITNAAREPEIIDLGECLIKMGAEIEGLGTAKITINGKSFLRGTEHDVVADRIEAGTFLIAGAMTGGEITLKNINIKHIECLIDPLYRAGVDITCNKNDISVKRVNNYLRGIDIMTEPYPGFPTDLQAQIMAMLTISKGAGMVTETIFENRFMHVPELSRMGADITVHGSSALIRGVKKLNGANVMATDLRASVSLVLAGLVAEGTTSVHRIYHLERGYENIVDKLSAVGARLKKVEEEKAA